MPTIKFRRDTTASWMAENPVLNEGEPGWDTDLKKLKLGDGSTPWAMLPVASGGQGPIGATGPAGDPGHIQEAPITFTAKGNIVAGDLVSLDGPKTVRKTSNVSQDSINKLKHIGTVFDDLSRNTNIGPYVQDALYDANSGKIIVVINSNKVELALGSINLDGTLSFGPRVEVLPTVDYGKIVNYGVGKFYLITSSTHKVRPFTVTEDTIALGAIYTSSLGTSIVANTYLGSNKILIMGIVYDPTQVQKHKILTIAGDMSITSADTSITPSSTISDVYPFQGSLQRTDFCWSPSGQRLIITRADSSNDTIIGRYLFDVYTWDGATTFTLEGTASADIDIGNTHGPLQIVEYASGKFLMTCTTGSSGRAAVMVMAGGTPKTLNVTATRSAFLPSGYPVHSAYGDGPTLMLDGEGGVFWQAGSQAQAQGLSALINYSMPSDTSIVVSGAEYEYPHEDKIFPGNTVTGISAFMPCATPAGTFAFSSELEEGFKLFYAKYIKANQPISNVRDWIGIANADKVGANVKVSLIGSHAPVAGPLVLGDTYYVSDTGTLVNTPTANGKIGIAVTPTKLYVNTAGKYDQTVSLLHDTFQGAFVEPRAKDINAISGAPSWVSAYAQDLSAFPLEVGGGLKFWTGSGLTGPVPEPFASGSGLVIDLGEDIESFTAEFVLSIHNQPLSGTFYLDLYVGNNGGAGLWTGDFIEFTAGGSYPVGYMTTYGFDPETQTPIQPGPTADAAYTVGDSTEHTYKFVYKKNGPKRLYFDGKLLFNESWTGQSWGTLADKGTFLQIDIFPGYSGWGLTEGEKFAILKSVEIRQGIF